MYYLPFLLLLLSAPIDARDFNRGGNRAINQMEQERREYFQGGPSESEEEYYQEVAPPTNIDDPDYYLEDHPLQEAPLQEDPIE